MKTRTFVLFVSQILLGLWLISCDDGAAEEDTDTGTDTTVPDDTDTGTEDTGTETEEESEIPPELPALCTTTTVAEFLSGPGDGRMPAISAITAGDAMVTYAYDPQDSDSTFHIQTATFDTDSGEYVSTPLLDDAIIATAPSIANDGTRHGIAWLEARTEWDTDCAADAIDDCDPDVVMATIENGVLDQTAPIRISTNTYAVGRPAIVPVSTGWVVSWASEYLGDISIMAASVSSDGTVGPIQDISDGNHADDSPQIRAAAIDDSVLVLWRGSSQSVIYYRMLGGNAQPTNELSILFEGSTAYLPGVAAGAAKFMVAFGHATQNDAEIFTRSISPDGVLMGQENRITWTNTWARGADITFVPGRGFAVSWLSDTANGSSTCVDSGCAKKVFASILNNDGTLASEPILVSDGAEDLNPCAEATIGTNGTDWLVTYQVRRQLRQQVSYSIFSCQ